LVQGASGDIILNPLCSRGSLYAEPGTEDRYQTLWGWRVQGFYNFKVMWEKYLKFLGTGPSGSVGLGLAEDPQGRTAGGFWALDGSARVAGLSGNFSNVFYLGPVPVKASFNWSVPLRFITPEAGWNGVLDTTVLLEPLTKKWGAWQYILPSAVGAEFSGFSDDQNRSGERQIKLYWGR
jgi:hypothetical protein